MLWATLLNLVLRYTSTWPQHNAHRSAHCNYRAGIVHEKVEKAIQEDFMVLRHSSVVYKDKTFAKQLQSLLEYVQEVK